MRKGSFYLGSRKIPHRDEQITGLSTFLWDDPVCYPLSLNPSMGLILYWLTHCEVIMRSYKPDIGYLPFVALFIPGLKVYVETFLCSV